MSDMKDRVTQVILAEADVKKGFIPNHAKNKFPDNSGNLKCPFCNGELVGTIGHPICRNQDCVMCDDPMPQELLELLDRTRKENEDKQAVLNCVVDMLKVLNQKYTLIMGKDVIKETVKLIEQKDVK